MPNEREPVDPKPAAPLRSNARQNRERILQSAHDALTKSAGASLNSIAKDAGVGIATIYRHFPTREALVLAVYRYEVQQVGDAAPRLLADHPPLEALREWLMRLAQYAMTKKGLADALSAAASSHAAGLADEAYGPVITAIRTLLGACEDAGSVRHGLDPDDVLLAMNGLFRMNPDGDWPAQAGRLSDLLIDGLRFGAPAPSPAHGR
jgi:AcrR family transcriptional regulator